MPAERIVEQLLAYLPQDRARAVLEGGVVPAEATGAVLFSDISGFTPLTEAVVARYGPRRGGEEFTDRLNAVYDALIEEVELYGGSIICFAGDAMTIWFAGDDGSIAVSAAAAMQRKMARFARVILPGGEVVALTMKIAVCAGALRRLVCGDPEIQLFDVLAGALMERLAACESVTRSGEISVDEATATRLGDRLQVNKWHAAGPADAAGRVAVVEPATPVPPGAPNLAVSFPPDAETRMRAWMLDDVHARIASGQNVFLTELRPTAAMFVRFSGIAFEEDPDAPQKLDAYFRWAQRIVRHLDGHILQISIGDKGSYFYAAFGAPVAHEDDTARALTAALTIIQPPPEIAACVHDSRIGITRGTMRTGAYGGTRRRTYGVLGDDVNLAARLMTAAGPGEILVTERVTARLGERFEFAPLAPIKVKGKERPVAIARLVAHRRRVASAALQSAFERSPMIGRRSELALAHQRLGEARQSRGQVVEICADAGMGKSRLLAEIVRGALEGGFEVFIGDCPVLAREASYSVWAPIWRGFFDLPPDAAIDAVEDLLRARLAAIDADLPDRAPLLGAILNLALPETNLTRSLDAKTRRSSLEGLLVECLRHRSRTRPVLLVLEETHWIDEASRRLLHTIVQAVPRLPVAVLLAHRPVPAGTILAAEDDTLQHVTRILLGDLPPDEARELVAFRLAAAYGNEITVPTQLVERVAARASGNPFFIEEVANLLKARNVDLQDRRALENLELPASLHSLVLSRIDQMGGDAQTTLKVASVIGRLFRAAMVWGVHPARRDPAGVDAHLREMCTREIALPEPAEGDQAYLFKHIVIQEVAYESLPFSLRAAIHEAIGDYIEKLAGENTRPWIDLLAFHYERSRRDDKKRHYLVAAGDAARASYSIQSATGYYRRALELLTDDARIDVLGKLGGIHEIAGDWTAAAATYREARTLAEAHGTGQQRAAAAAAIGELHRKRGDFKDAAEWLDRARREYAEIGDELGAAQVLHLEGTLSAQTGNFTKATALYRQALALREHLGAELEAARTLNNLGIVARAQGDVATALDHYQRSLEVRRRLDDKREIANSLNNLGFAHRYRREYDKARPLLEESVKLNRTVGDRWSTANALTSLAELALDIGDTAAAAAALKESISINRELGDKRALAFLLEAFGHLSRLQGQAAPALTYFAAASTLRTAIGAPLEPADAEKLETVLADIRASLAPELRDAAEADGRQLPLSEILDLATG
ncbi:adenylate/guanylate cyclase domain-containing protein [Opitutales bacterium ASA1]|uniref:tetratricopeptide repeat protein n=1 Tax=Congregicoccus parvus TaxID=3081749 RepID=UPI002B2DC910|nr:adenylate/guanylate cyclase domain-containing protein [Opitutales bacterium ASA1]